MITSPLARRHFVTMLAVFSVALVLLLHTQLTRERAERPHSLASAVSATLSSASTSLAAPPPPPPPPLPSSLPPLPPPPSPSLHNGSGVAAHPANRGDSAANAN